MSKPKSDTAFRTIGEVAEELGVQQHVLRFWETKFTQIKPLKRAGGRRYYRPEDVALISKIHQLLYQEGYTIKGAQQCLKGVPKSLLLLSKNQPTSEISENGIPNSQDVSLSTNAPSPPLTGNTLSAREYTSSLQAVLQELLDMREQVRALISN